MASELKIFSGKCKYKDIDFTFVFDCNELRLIPPADAKDTIQTEWIMTPLVKGVYIKEDPLTMDDPYLTGHCSETNTDFIFITKQGDYISSRNSVLFVPVVAYIDCKYARDSIARMSFSCPVINQFRRESESQWMWRISSLRVFALLPPKALMKLRRFHRILPSMIDKFL